VRAPTAIRDSTEDLVMRSPLAYRPRPTLAAGLLAAALTTACSDSLVGPPGARAGSADVPIARQSAPAPSLAATVTARLLVSKQDVERPAGAVVLFSTSHGNTEVADNSDADLDKDDGEFEVTLPGATSYKAQLTQTPDAFQPNTKVYTGTLGADGVVTFPVVVLAPRTALNVWFVDFYTRKKLGGATITISSPLTGYTRTITDGTASEGPQGSKLAPADGRVVWSAQAWGPYTVCEIAPPSGFSLPSPNCQSFTFAKDVAGGNSASLTFEHVRGIVAPPPPAPM
jgi:hypothetical protein